MSCKMFWFMATGCIFRKFAKLLFYTQASQYYDGDVVLNLSPGSQCKYTTRHRLTWRPIATLFPIARQYWPDIEQRALWPRPPSSANRPQSAQLR